MTNTEEKIIALRKQNEEVMSPWDLGFNAGLDSCLIVVRTYLNAPSCKRCGSAVINGRCIKCSSKE